MVQIKKNDYSQPTEIREDVVQGICDAFLAGNCRSKYHPFKGSNNGSRKADTYIIRPNGREKYTCFHHEIWRDEEGIKFNGAEMKRAFEELIKAGYYMFRCYHYGEWLCYVCHDKPFFDGHPCATRVTEFNEQID